MNLLSLLLKGMTTAASVNALSQKTGISAKTIKKLLPLALPILLKAMTSNASSSSGAQSLLGALTQHTNKKPLEDQISNADEKDGAAASEIMAGALLSIIPLIIIYAIFQKQFIEGIALTGIKG